MMLLVSCSQIQTKNEEALLVNDALKPPFKCGGIIKFASNKKASLVILLPEQPTKVDIQAATELQNGLREITGATFEVIRNAVPTTPYISIGETALFKKQPFSKEIKKCSPDGYGIHVKGDSLYLFGGERAGSLNAALALLEEDLGCRWYGSRKLDYYPLNTELSARIATRLSNPAFSGRNPFTVLSHNKDFCRRNRIMFDDGFGYVPGWFAHTYEKIYSQENFSKHPEYFMMDKEGKRNKRQLCPSNLEVRRLAVLKVREALRNNRDPGKFLISISQNDRKMYCHCPTCMNTIKKYGDAPIAPHLELVNLVADSIKHEFPNYRITFLCYHHTQKAPVGMKIPENVCPRFCITNDDKLSLIDAGSGKCSENLHDWTTLSHNVMIWDYMVDFKDYFMPFPSFGIIAGNLKLYRRYGCKSVMIQGNHQSTGGDRPEMRAWIASKLLWDPSRNLHALMNDFNYGVYGPAAPAMNKYDALIAQLKKKRETDQGKYNIYDFAAKSAKLFEEGEEMLSKAKRTDLMPRLELAKLPIATLQLESLAATAKNDPAKFNKRRYVELLSFLKKVVKRENITKYSERTTMAYYIAEKQALLDSFFGNGVLTISPKDMILYRPIGAKIVKDPLSVTGQAFQQVCNGTWSAQWDIPYKSLRPNTRYQFRALARVDNAGGNEKVWVGGVYDRGAKKRIREYSVVGKNLSPHEYRWFNLGAPFLPLPKYTFWSAGVKNHGRIKKLYIAKLKLIPLSKK